MSLTTLLDLYDAHITSLAPRRAELLRRQADSAADAEEQWAVMCDLATVQARARARRLDVQRRGRAGLQGRWLAKAARANPAPCPPPSRRRRSSGRS